VKSSADRLLAPRVTTAPDTKPTRNCQRCRVYAAARHSPAEISPFLMDAFYLSYNLSQTEVIKNNISGRAPEHLLASVHRANPLTKLFLLLWMRNCQAVP
jgi:hypothetical protein